MGCKTADEVPLQGRCVNSLAQLAIKKYDPVRMYMKDYKYRLIVNFVVINAHPQNQFYLNSTGYFVFFCRNLVYISKSIKTGNVQ